MATSSYPALPIFSFLGFLTVLIPLPWQFQAWNAGTCMYIAWTAIGCLIVFVNTIVWRDNVLDVAPVWCDISTKILIGTGIGIPAASLCIVRRLYILLHVQTVVLSRRARLWSIAIDLSISLGFPILIMILHCIVQGHRYDILEQVGCLPTIYNTLPAYVILYMWPITLGCISFVYSVLILYHFFQRRAQFNRVVSSTSISQNRYLRLMLLACVEMMCTIPISAFSMYLNTAGIPLEPYISWDNVHYGFDFVGQYPAVLWMMDPSGRASVELSQWLFPVCAFLFFALFGFGEEARRKYRAAFQKVFGGVDLNSYNGKNSKFSDSGMFSRSRVDLLSKSSKGNMSRTNITVTTTSETTMSFTPIRPVFTPKTSTGESFMDMSDRASTIVGDFDFDVEKMTPTGDAPEYTEKA